jgi:hypothetical protein
MRNQRLRTELDNMLEYAFAHEWTDARMQRYAERLCKQHGMHGADVRWTPAFGGYYEIVYPDGTVE